MKKTTSRILLSALTVLALLSLSGCAQEKEENTEENDPQAREAILQCCETIFGSAEETATYHIRVTDEQDGGRVDEYNCPRGADEQGYGNSPVYALTEPSMYGDEPWYAAVEQDWDDCRNGIVAEISYGEDAIAFIPPWGAMKPDAEYEHPGGNVLRLTRNGETTYYKSSTTHAAQLLFGYAQDAVMKELYDLHVPGTETDYENIANEFCAQFAANLNATPCWYYRKPDDAAVQELSSRVFDAYYGEEDPNFCFEFGAMLRFDEPESSRRYGWEAGSGMIEPSGEGEYGDYYRWVVGADACKNEEGDWYIEGTWTGGGGVRLPYIGRDWDSGQQTATTSQLVECWLLSAGESHEWRLPNMIYNRPSAELREALASLAPEQAAELEKGLREVWDDPLHADMFPGGYDAKLSAD